MENKKEKLPYKNYQYSINKNTIFDNKMQL